MVKLKAKKSEEAKNAENVGENAAENGGENCAEKMAVRKRCCRKNAPKAEIPKVRH